jgi:hypothetical protein
LVAPECTRTKGPENEVAGDDHVVASVAVDVAELATDGIVAERVPRNRWSSRTGAGKARFARIVERILNPPDDHVGNPVAIGVAGRCDRPP